jgi:hypothetical protein
MPRPVDRTITNPHARGWLRLTTLEGRVHYLNLEQMAYVRLAGAEATFSLSTADGISDVGCFRLSVVARKRLSAVLSSPESGWIELEDAAGEQRFLHFSLILRVDYAQGAAGPLITTRHGRSPERVVSPGGQSCLRRLLAHAGIAADLEAGERPAPVPAAR